MGALRAHLRVGADGEAATLLEPARRAVELRPGFTSRFNLALVTAAAGDPAAALALVRRALEETERPHVEGVSLAAAALIALGRPEEAEAALRPWIVPSVPEASRHIAATQLALALALQGRRQEALRVASRAGGSSNRFGTLFQVELRGIGGDRAAVRSALAGWPDPPASAAQVLAEHGLTERAEAALAGLPGDHPERALAAAAAARYRGDATEAVRRYRAAIGEGRDAEEAFLVGEALAAAGACEAALPELDRVGRFFPWVWFSRTLGVRLPLAILEAARCEERLGRAGAARARIERLLASWRRADPDLPALAEATALRRRLGASARP